MAKRGASEDHWRGGHPGDLAGLLIGDLQAVQRLGPLALQFRRGKGRVARHVGQDRHPGGELVRHHVQGDRGFFEGRARFQRGAQGLDLAGDGLRRAGPGALGEHPGGHAGRAGEPPRIGPGAGPDRQAGGHQRQGGGPRHDHPQAVGQGLFRGLRQPGGHRRAERRRRLSLARRGQGVDRPVIGRGDGRDRRGGRGLALRLLAFRAVADGHPGLRVEVLPRHPLHVSGGDGLQVGELSIGLGRVAIDAQRIAQREAAPVERLAFAQLAGDQLVRRLIQLRGGRRAVAQGLDLGQQARFALGYAVARSHHRADHEVPRLGRQVGVGIDLRGDLLVVDQRVIEPRRFAGRQDGVQHLQGGRIRIGRLGPQPGDRHGRQRDIGAIALIDAGALARRLDDGDAPDRLGGGLQRAQVLVDPGAQLGFVEVADHDQGGVVGPVIGVVEGPHIVDGRRVQLLDRTDARPMIGMGRVGRLRHIEAEQPPIGRGQHPLAQLLLDHVAFGFEICLVDHQRAHPLALRPDQPLQVAGRNHLVVVGEVVVGGGVVDPAHILGQPVKALGRQVAGGLEHHVLEQVREAGPAGRIVLRPHTVPDLHRHIGRRPVERGVDLQPVGQGVLLVDDRRDLAGLGGWRGVRAPCEG